MKSRFTLLLLCTAFFFTNVDAQVYIWGGPENPNSEFADGLNDWTTNAISSLDPDSTANAVWVWDADGAADNGAYWGAGTALESPSIANGVALFNSDFLDNAGTQGNFGGGAAPSPQISELISPVFDCTANESVVISFYQNFRNFDASASIDVSTDGGASFTSYPISDETFTNDNITFAESFYRLNITDQAAGMDSVQFKFVWNGDYYYWMVDDVYVIEQPDFDVSVGEIYFSAENAATPVSQIDAVEHLFSMDLENAGRMDQYDIKVVASITDDEFEPLYSDTMIIDTVLAGSLTTYDFDSIVSPVGQPFGEMGDYFVSYEVLSEDVSERDNQRLEPFSVTEDFFSKDNQRFQYWGIGSNLIGNLYSTGAWEGSGNGSFIATKMYVSLTDGGAVNGGSTLADLTGTIFRVNDDVDANFDNFDTNADPTVVADHPNLTPVGYIVASVDGDDRGIFALDLIDFESDEAGIALEPSSRYFFLIQDEDPSVTKFFGFDRYIDFFQISTVTFSPGDQFYLGGYGADFSFGGAIDVEFTSSTEENELPETSMSVFPNPAKDIYNLELNFPESTDVTVLLTGIDGKIYAMDNLKKVNQMTKTYNTNNLSSGTYLVRILTDTGVKTNKIVIQK